MQEIKVSFDANLGEAIQAMIEVIQPSRRKLAQQKKKLENTQLQSAIKKQNAEALLEKARVSSEEAEAQRLLAEAQKMNADAELIAAQAAKERAEVDRIYLNMAMEIINFIDPEGINPAKKFQYTIQALEILKQGNLSGNALFIPNLNDGD